MGFHSWYSCCTRVCVAGVSCGVASGVGSARPIAWWLVPTRPRASGSASPRVVSRVGVACLVTDMLTDVEASSTGVWTCAVATCPEARP